MYEILSKVIQQYKHKNILIGTTYTLYPNFTHYVYIKKHKVKFRIFVNKLASLSFRTERAKPKMRPNDYVSTN